MWVCSESLAASQVLLNSAAMWQRGCTARPAVHELQLTCGDGGSGGCSRRA